MSRKSMRGLVLTVQYNAGDYVCKVSGTEVTTVSSLKLISKGTNTTPTPTLTTYTTPGPNGSSSLAGAIAGVVFGAILCIVLFSS